MSAIAAAAIAVGSAVVKGISSNRQKNAANTHDLNKIGIQHAQIESEIARRQEALSKEARAYQQTHMNNQLIVEKQAMSAKAAAEVQAAAAGTAGQATDLTSAAVDFNAGQSIGQLDRRLEHQLNQLDDTSRDIAISGRSAMAVPDVDTTRTGAGLADLFRSASLLNLGFSL